MLGDHLDRLAAKGSFLKDFAFDCEKEEQAGDQGTSDGNVAERLRARDEPVEDEV